MTRLQNCINNLSTDKCVWFMRQAGRYLPEFRKIRSENPNFVNLCLNEELSKEITLQPIRRFNLDAAIIFSDILLVPNALRQNVTFKKDLGPILEEIDIKKMESVDEVEFIEKLKPVYNAINLAKKSPELKNKDLIGFVGAPWTLLIYMLNGKSPKNIDYNFLLKDKKKIDFIINTLEKFLKIHIDNQIKNGATVIQIFDSWAGLLEEVDLNKYVYETTSKLVDFVKGKKIPVICFPKGIKDYKKYVRLVKPQVISIDYEVDPKFISENIDITVQGGLDPKFLVGDRDLMKKKAINYLNIFKDKSYIFNLGHGVLPETNPDTVEYLVKLVKEYK